MKKIKAIHIDDEQLAREGFSTILTRNFQQVDLVGQAESASEGIKLVNKLKPDVVFLDISMPGGSGFVFLDAFEELFFEVAFLTAHDNYAIQAIKKGAIDYLLKPIDLEELKQVIDKITAKIQANDGGQKIYINNQESIEIISLKDISFLKSDNNYTYIYLDSGEKVLSSKNLSHYAKLLHNESFVKVHQSYIVKISKVQKFIKEDNGLLVMSNNHIIPISRRNKVEISQYFKN